MKDLKNLQGAKMLSKSEQKFIKGGIAPIPVIVCDITHPCPPNYLCMWASIESGICVKHN